MIERTYAVTRGTLHDNTGLDHRSGRRDAAANLKVSEAFACPTEVWTVAKERDALEGNRWARRVVKTAWRACARFRLPSGRATSTLLLVLSLLAPYGASLSLLLERDASNCGMPCCKRTKACFCRKSSHRAHEAGPAWSSSSKCPDGCGQFPATQGSRVASLATTRFETTPVAASSQGRWATDQNASSALVAFALFGRPPPSA